MSDVINLPSNLPSEAVRKIIYARDDLVCHYCGRKNMRSSVIEHVVPSTKGGPALPYNLVVACTSCNRYKGGNVWVPDNLDAITQHYPEWRAVVLALATNREDNDYVPLTIELSLRERLELEKIALIISHEDGKITPVDAIVRGVVADFIEWYYHENGEALDYHAAREKLTKAS